MSQRTLYLRLADEDESVEWLMLAADGGRRTGRCALVELQNEFHGARLAVLVPSTAITFAKAALPPVKRAQLRQAALYALEDQLIDDPADLHAALGERDSDGSIPVAVVSRTRMDHWLEQLAQHHWHPELLVADLLMLPLAAGEWSVLWEDDGVRVRTGVMSGFSFDTEHWPLLWPRLLAEAGEQLPQRIQVFDARSSATFPLPIDNLLPGSEVVVVPHAAGMQWVSTTDTTMAPLNLLQGDFSRREQWGRRLRPWRPAAALLFVWLMIQGGMALIDLHALRHQDRELDEQMVALYRSSFPDARKVVDARQQMEQKLLALKNGDGGFMKLALAAAPALQNSLVKGMRYQDGALDIDVSMADMTALDALRAALVSKGLQVEISNAAQQDGKVESRLTVRGGGA